MQLATQLFPSIFFHEDNPENTSHNMTLISGAETQPVVRFHLSQLHQGFCKLQGPKGKEGAYWPEIIQHIAISHCSLRIADCCSFFQKDIESAVHHLLIQQIGPIHLHPETSRRRKTLESKQQVIRTNIGFIDLHHNASRPSHGWKVYPTPLVDLNDCVPWRVWNIQSFWEHPMESRT